jgi:hypothetical protein
MDYPAARLSGCLAKLGHGYGCMALGLISMEQDTSH